MPVRAPEVYIFIFLYDCPQGMTCSVQCGRALIKNKSRGEVETNFYKCSKTFNGNGNLNENLNKFAIETFLNSNHTPSMQT